MIKHSRSTIWHLKFLAISSAAGRSTQKTTCRWEAPDLIIVSADSIGKTVKIEINFMMMISWQLLRNTHFRAEALALSGGRERLEYEDKSMFLDAYPCFSCRETWLQHQSACPRGIETPRHTPTTAFHATLFRSSVMCFCFSHISRLKDFLRHSCLPRC